MQIEIKDEAKLKEISEEAKQYANAVISTETSVNWKIIYDLRFKILKLNHSETELTLQMMQREKKREKQHQDTVNQLKDQVKELQNLLDKSGKKQ